MSNVLIVFGSTSGNTAYLSKFVQSGLEKAGHTVVRKNVKEAQIEELSSYDLIVLGSSTWDGQKIDGVTDMKEQNRNVQGRLQIDMRPFVEAFSHLNLDQKPVAIFGVGHYSYTYTCNAANLLEDAVKQANGKLVVDTFRVTDVADLSADAIELWAKDIQF